MPFSDVQKRDIRKYLGVPFGYYDLSSRLESIMDKVGSVATDQAEIETWLTRLAQIDVALTSSTAATASYGSIKKVDEVEFFPVDSSSSSSDSSIGLVNQGRLLIDRIARSLGVDDILPNGDYFGANRKRSAPLELG